MINELCRHNYGHRNLGHGRFRPEVLRHWYFYMMGVMGCVHKVNSRMFHTLMLGEILFSRQNNIIVRTLEIYSCTAVYICTSTAVEVHGRTTAVVPFCTLLVSTLGTSSWTSDPLGKIISSSVLIFIHRPY